MDLGGQAPNFAQLQLQKVKVQGPIFVGLQRDQLAPAFRIGSGMNLLQIGGFTA